MGARAFRSLRAGGVAAVAAFDAQVLARDEEEPRTAARVERRRALGAAVKLCGSGGAVIGVMQAEGDFEEIELAYRDAGLCAIRPAPTSEAP